MIISTLHECGCQGPQKHFLWTALFVTSTLFFILLLDSCLIIFFPILNCYPQKTSTQHNLENRYTHQVQHEFYLFLITNSLTLKHQHTYSSFSSGNKESSHYSHILCKDSWFYYILAGFSAENPHECCPTFFITYVTLYITRVYF